MKITIPNYAQLIEYTFKALKELGGSGNNTEINDKVAQLMNLPEEVLDVRHLNSSSMSEVNYRCAWARTLLKNHGAIENSARSVWAIADNHLGFKPYEQFGKSEISERISLLVQLVRLVWNDEMFK